MLSHAFAISWWVICLNEIPDGFSWALLCQWCSCFGHRARDGRFFYNESRILTIIDLYVFHFLKQCAQVRTATALLSKSLKKWKTFQFFCLWIPPFSPVWFISCAEGAHHSFYLRSPLTPVALFQVLNEKCVLFWRFFRGGVQGCSPLILWKHNKIHHGISPWTSKMICITAVRCVPWIWREIIVWVWATQRILWEQWPAAVLASDTMSVSKLY